MLMEAADQHNPPWVEQLGNQGNQIKVEAGSQGNLLQVVPGNQGNQLWRDTQQQVEVWDDILGIHKEVGPGTPQGRQG